MTIEINKFARKTFYVDAVTVTDDNMSQVAEWCSGTVHNLQDGDNGEGHTQYIKVQVHRPLNERQTRAFVGDRVLRRSDYHAGSGFKVFTPIAFEKSFEAAEESKEENLLTEIFSGGTDGEDLGRSPV
jgi:hypothetical protein